MCSMPALHQQDSRLLHVWRFVSADQSRPCQAQIPFAPAVGVRARWRKLQVATRIPLMALCCSCCGDVLPMSCQGLDRFADFFRAPLFKKERAVLSSDAGFEAHLCKPNLCWGSAFCCVARRFLVQTRWTAMKAFDRRFLQTRINPI